MNGIIFINRLDDGRIEQSVDRFIYFTFLIYSIAIVSRENDAPLYSALLKVIRLTSVENQVIDTPVRGGGDDDPKS